MVLGEEVWRVYGEDKGSGGMEDKEPEDKALETALSWHLFRASLSNSLVLVASCRVASREATLCLRIGT